MNVWLWLKMNTIAFPLLAFATIVNINVVTTNAFVPTPTTSRCSVSRQPWPRAFVSISEPALAAKDSEISGASGSNGFWDRLETIMFAPLEMKTENGNASDDEDPRFLLAEWENMWDETVEIYDDNDGLANRNATAAATAAAESLTNFLEVWAKITLQDDKGLTTPVSSTKFTTKADDLTAVGTHQEAMSNDDDAGYLCENRSSMKLIFRPPKRYLSYKEQKSMEKGVLPDRKGGKVDAWSPGGVEIQVTTTTVTRAIVGTKMNQRSVLGVTARRCNIDGDTIIKKTSERAIIRRLENAVRIWKKSNQDKNR